MKTRNTVRGSAVLVLLAGLAAGPAWAGPGNDYCVKHRFRITTPGTVAPLVMFKHWEATFARTDTCKDADNASAQYAIGLGTATETIFSVAPGSDADATAEATVTELAAGVVGGTIEARGNTDPSVAGCPVPALRHSGTARAASHASLRVRGQKIDRNGNIVFAGNWRSLPPVGHMGIPIDPIRARLIDQTTNITTEYTLLTIKAMHSAGELAWDGGVLSNSSSNLELNIVLGSPVIVQQGTIHLKVVGGVVTESSATGEFDSMALPGVGSPGGFSVPMPDLSIDYDLGGDPANDLIPELDFENAGENEEEVAAIMSGCLLTDIHTGFGGWNVSEMAQGFSAPGFDASLGIRHLAVDFTVPPGPAVSPAMLKFPMFQAGAPANVPLMGAYVRLWRGQPGAGGAVVAGDLTTNRLVSCDFSGVYRVRGQLQDPSMAIKEALLDMSWCPPLPAGQYWLEVAARGQPNFGSAMAPGTSWASPQDNALVHNPSINQWMPLRDPLTQRPVDVPFVLSIDAPAECYANCDGSTNQPVLNVNDFVCFQARFAAGEPYADCDHNHSHNVNDFVCFQGAFAAGCR